MYNGAGTVKEEILNEKFGEENTIGNERKGNHSPAYSEAERKVYAQTCTWIIHTILRSGSKSGHGEPFSVSQLPCDTCLMLTGSWNDSLGFLVVFRVTSIATKNG